MIRFPVVPEIILGPPGSGKTTTALNIVEEELAAGTPPDRIGLVTFTRRGAFEAAKRAAEKFKVSEKHFRYFRTIHSLCFKAAGVSGSDILEGRRVVEFGDWLGLKLSESMSMEEGSTFGYEPGDRALFMENLARVRCVPLREQYDRNDDSLEWTLVDRVSRGLAEYKKRNHLLDYTDLLQSFLDGEWCPVLDVLIVDESQDLSRLQWRVIEKLATHARRVVLIGDDDQAIYEWAGADVETFIDLPGTVKVLEQSWRVPRVGQRLAEEIIGRVRHRRPKVWKPRPEEGTLQRVQSLFDINAMRDKDLLILGRNAFVLKPVMTWLRSEGAIFEFRGHSSVTRKSLEAVVNWEKLRKGESISREEAVDMYGYLSMGIGVKRGHKQLPGFQQGEQVTMRDLRERGGLMTDTIWHDALDRMAPEERTYMLRALRKGESLRKKPRVRVSSMHAIKGGEADHVVIIRDMASRTFQEMHRWRDEEARVWYVAATRFREKLSIVAPRTRMCYDL